MTAKKPPIDIEMSWSGDLLFEIENAKGLKMALDGDTEEAFSPMEGLLASLCGCLAIDVVMILKRMRQDLKSFSVKAQGARMDDPPRYFRQVRLVFRAGGELSRAKVERAIALSFEKYCSVLHTLRPDLEIEHELKLE